MFGAQKGRTCVSCAYFSSKDQGVQDRAAFAAPVRRPNSSDGGQCRRNAPGLMALKWPNVQAYDWCGDWEYVEDPTLDEELGGPDASGDS